MSKKGGKGGVPSSTKDIKAVFLGDHNVGKTALIHRYATGAFPDAPEQIQPMLALSTQKNCGGQDVNWGLWDTKGTVDFDSIRPFAYHGVELFFLCFSLDSRASFESIEKKYVPELKTLGFDITPVILVGLKSDIPREVENQEVLQVAQRLEASQYVEVSAWQGTNVEKVFNEGMRAFLFPVVRKKAGKKK